jgi:hypothetical protein
MTSRALQSLRLELKRAFSAYVVDLISPGIADPTEAFSASSSYLAALLERLGPHEFMRRLDDETTQMAGEVHQDLRRRLRDGGVSVEYGEVEDRLRECFEYALAQLNTLLNGSQ